ncbi:hypothetical protein [Methylobacterium sp. J-068]|uniref:hypothetical protein n=1 Tax=Methylobacterium sp. J-068 TaxID=2836649 RepID=UPI001FBAB300|nr:hypothetical protein [Methylobacterium sp. J-068]MCJ2035650.1 hypothetical protein [Methylobacterium sp. J-068]
MREHHKDASAQVAQALLAGMSPDEQAEVQAEADLAGVSAVEIVRRSLDILIADSEVLARRNTDAGTLPQ